MKKKIYRWHWIVMVIAIAVTLLAGTALLGHSFRFTQQAVTIPVRDGSLAGILTLPPTGQARGLVVMVHGDGPVEATQDGLYFPWFEGAADAGFATLSWSKPGIGDSDGHWLSQSMDDRASEVIAVLDWARTNADLPTGKIVLWGASQAGWVLPKVTRVRQDISGVVAVGPAINWLRQGRFNLLAELEHNNADLQEREAAMAYSDQMRQLLERKASYQNYLALAPRHEPVTADRWSFILRNFEADATGDLAVSASRKIPIHLMLGIHDRNVDVVETENAYRSVYGSLLTVTHVDGAHSMARTVMEDNGTIGFLTAVFWPRTLLAPGTIDRYRHFLSDLGTGENPDERDVKLKSEQ